MKAYTVSPSQSPINLCWAAHESWHILVTYRAAHVSLFLIKVAQWCIPREPLWSNSFKLTPYVYGGGATGMFACKARGSTDLTVGQKPNGQRSMAPYVEPPSPQPICCPHCGAWHVLCESNICHVGFTFPPLHHPELCFGCPLFCVPETDHIRKLCVDIPVVSSPTSSRQHYRHCLTSLASICMPDCKMKKYPVHLPGLRRA